MQLSWPISYLSWPIDRLPIVAESVIRNLRGWLVPARFLGAMWSVNHFVVRHGIFYGSFFRLIQRQKNVFVIFLYSGVVIWSFFGDPTVVNWSGLRRSQMNHPPFSSADASFPPTVGYCLLAMVVCSDDGPAHSAAPFTNRAPSLYTLLVQDRVMLKYKRLGSSYYCTLQK